eukprot:symbB.v1.2.014386.t1/scaffold1052.1/size141681/3
MSPSRDRDHQKISFTSAMPPKKAKVKKGAVKKKFAKKPAKKPAASPVPHTLGRSEFAPSAFEKSKESPLCGVIARDCHGAHAGIPGSKKLQSVWRDAMENTYGENVARQAQENVALGMNCWHLKMEVHHSYDANNEEQDLETNMIAFLPTTKLPAEFKSLDEMPCEHPFDAYILVRGADARETAQFFVSGVCTKHGGKEAEDGESYKIGEDGLITIFKNYPEELKTAVEDLRKHEFKYTDASPLTLKTHAGTEERTAKYDCITKDSVSDEVKKVADLADVKVIGYPDNPKWLHDSTPKFMKVSVGGTVHFFNLRVKLEDADNVAEVTAYKAAHEKEEKDPKKLKTEGVEEEPKPLIQLSTCLARFGAPEEGVEFRGSAASKTTRIATMPRYLLVQLQRYFVDEKWCPAKLDCKVPMPETLNLEHLRGKGLQAGEEEMPEEPDAGATAPTAAAAPEADEMIVAQLLSMGIGENAAKRASLAVNNSGAEAACAWFFEHSEDPDINLPPTAGYAGGTAAAAEGFDPEAVSMLCSMGFAEGHVHAALKSCMNSVERAADWLFSHADDLDAAVAAVNGSSNATPSEAKADNEDGVGEYELMGFVSHIGKHTSHGHYVCHMRRGEGGSWVIFDDSKVAKSEAPPLELGYLYLYRRKDLHQCVLYFQHSKDDLGKFGNLDVTFHALGRIFY